MTETDVGDKLKAFCSNCRGDRNCYVRGLHNEGGDDADGQYQWYRQWQILQCCGCDETFVQTSFTDSETYEHDEDGNIYSISTVERWPAKSKRQTPEWFNYGINPSTIDSYELDSALRELYGALDNDLSVLSAIGVRTVFDIASELLGVPGDFPFSKKLKKLAEEKYITEGDKEHLGVLIEAGSAAAHRGFRPSTSDLDVLMSTLENFLYSSFVLPAKQEAHAQQVDRVKKNVPVRPPKTDEPNKDEKPLNSVLGFESDTSKT